MKTLKHQFVDKIPNELEEGVLYISVRYNIVSHLCACGCGEEVVTSLTPGGWHMTYNGESISLYPSIGNTFDCRSHYWIEDNNIKWCDSPTFIPDDYQNRKRKRWWRFFMSFIGL